MLKEKAFKFAQKFSCECSIGRYKIRCFLREIFFGDRPVCSDALLHFYDFACPISLRKMRLILFGLVFQEIACRHGAVRWDCDVFHVQRE